MFTDQIHNRSICSRDVARPDKLLQHFEIESILVNILFSFSNSPELLLVDLNNLALHIGVISLTTTALSL